MTLGTKFGYNWSKERGGGVESREWNILYRILMTPQNLGWPPKYEFGWSWWLPTKFSLFHALMVWQCPLSICEAPLSKIITMKILFSLILYKFIVQKFIVNLPNHFFILHLSPTNQPGLQTVLDSWLSICFLCVSVCSFRCPWLFVAAYPSN